MKNRPESIYWDKMWNLFVGCTKCGPGCDNCWAEQWKKRFAGNDLLEPEVKGRNIRAFKNHIKILENPLGWRKPQTIAVAFLSDLFHPEVDETTQIMMFKVMLNYAPQHRYLILTKRPDRMRKMVKWICKREGEYGIDPMFIDNIWFGISAENQEMYNKRMYPLLQMPVKNKFVSLEPLLGQIDISDENMELDQVIVGAESGKGRRKCDPEWIEKITADCKVAGIPCFVKQIHTPDLKVCKDISLRAFWTKGIAVRKLAWEK